jgi:hypothetical protein
VERRKVGPGRRSSGDTEATTEATTGRTEQSGRTEDSEVEHSMFGRRFGVELSFETLMVLTTRRRRDRASMYSASTAASNGTRREVSPCDIVRHAGHSTNGMTICVLLQLQHICKAE